jgi:hypothetical protein
MGSSLLDHKRPIDASGKMIHVARLKAAIAGM